MVGNVNIIDILVPLVLIIGIVSGWREGFVKTVCSFVGFIAGLVVALFLYGLLGNILAPTVGGNISVARLIAFLLIWVAVPLGVGVLGDMLTHILNALPLIGKVNSLAGALIGFIKVFLLVCCVINVLILSNAIGPDMISTSFCAMFMKEFFHSFVDSYTNAMV